MTAANLRTASLRLPTAPLSAFAALMFFFSCAQPIRAHDIPRSESKIDVQGRTAHVVLKINLLELSNGDTNGDGLISYDELDNSIDRVYAEIRKNYILRAPDLPVQVTLQRYSVVEGHVLQAELLYVFAADIRQMDVTSTFDHIMQQGHQHLVTFGTGNEAQEAVLDSGSQHVAFMVGGTSYPRIIWSFVHLGILHIFTGYDHLAFLLGLLIVTTNLPSLIKDLTSFTVAHSITLGVATFGVLILPTRVTESMIALSIAYVAIENLLGVRTTERYRITFLFGLVHGFGFSNVLREMQLSRSHLALSLFSFNTGVEIGQIAFVLLVFPLVVYLASKDRWMQVRTGVSLAVMCLAIYWFVQRAFLL